MIANIAFMFGALGVWGASYQILQILRGNVNLKEDYVNNDEANSL